MLEPISNPMSSVPAIIIIAPTDMITIVCNPFKNISMLLCVSCDMDTFFFHVIKKYITNMNIAVIIDAAQFMYSNTIKNINTKGQSNIQLVIDDVLIFLIIVPALSNFLYCCAVSCPALLNFSPNAFNRGSYTRWLKAVIILPLFCLKVNSNAMANTAPIDKLINVAVTPDVRYLLRTIITNSAGAKAQIPIMKLLVNSIDAVPGSLDRCRIRFFIICVFNESVSLVLDLRVLELYVIGI